MKINKNRKRKGNAVLEMGLMAMPVTTLLLGTVLVGLNLGRSIHVAQLNRDAAAMYVRGIDFTSPGNRAVLVRLAEGLGLTDTGGNGVVYFSKVTWIPQSKCTALGLTTCNADKHVITQRIAVGNTSMRGSTISNPNSSLIDGRGLVSNYMTDSSAQVALPWMQLNENEYAYIAESYFASPQYDMPGFRQGTGVYAIAMY